MTPGGSPVRIPHLELPSIVKKNLFKTLHPERSVRLFGTYPRMMKSSGKNTIIIVESDAPQAHSLRSMLGEKGYRTAIAGNGKEALDAARKARPALVLSEVVLPSMDGLSMCREMKADPALKGVPVLLLTRLSAIEDILKGLDCGADGYITKPFSAEFLISSISSLLSNEHRVQNNQNERRMELDFGGRRFSVNAGRAQTVRFLLSTYENAVFQNTELCRAQEELKLLNERLEDMVRERTVELSAEVLERKAAELALRGSEERFRAVLDAASDTVICLGTQDRIYVWNRKAEEMFGYPASEAIGSEMHELIVPPRYREKARERLNQFFKSGKGDILGRTVEVKAMRRDGSEFPVEVSIAAFKLEGKWNAVGIIRDITARKRLEEDLRQNIEDLERMNRLMVGRELRMEDLRDEVRKLRERVRELEDGAGDIARRPQ